MTLSVNNIPSMNTPFTDKNGRINPIWYEFFRKFVSASVDGTISEEAATTTVTAGNGLTGGGVGNVTLTVGQGSGIIVNADDVAVDISSQTAIQAALDDEVLVADVSDNNSIRKTKVRSLVELSAPGGSNSHVQYNLNGIFMGDSGLTYDGAGTLSINTVTSTNGDLTLANNGTGITRVTGTNPVIAGSAGSSTIKNISFAGNNIQLTGGASTSFISAAATGWTIQPGASQTCQINTGGMTLAGLQFFRSIAAGVTASTTQTQGNGALTNDYNNVSTVAHDNDTVTLPSAVAASFCFVRNNGANILQVFPASGDDLGAGANTATTISPGATAIWIAIDSTNWYQIVGVLRRTVKAGITASTTQTQGQGPLTADVNEISTVANANDTVTLPAAPAYSRTVRIINNGVNTLKIYPASGDDLGAGVDTSTTLAAGSNVAYTNYNATVWETI